MKIGAIQLDLISDGSLWLDGGAMFGVVPKPLWGKGTLSDSKNRIRLGLNCLLIRSPEKIILIDTGCGHKYTPKQLQIYNIEHEEGLLGELSACGLGPEDVDVVVNTHLHFDHCGGNTVLHDGNVTATFPNATYMLRRAEYEAACNPNPRTQSTYLPHNWEVLTATGQLQLIDEDREIIPGVSLIGTPGHTTGHQSVKITSDEQTVFYMADLCPTQAHAPLPWIMSFDLYPMTTMDTRRTIYRKAIQEDWLLLFEHDPNKPAGYLMEDQGTYKVRPHTWVPGAETDPGVLTKED
jgi:glyoxylase-like metal-dependent hydrolase (beta-lactamase superfamily II)